jgi:coenzyme F420 hydrogenase subunit beta
MVKVFNHLVEEVIKPEFCVRCGACVATCPVKCLEQKEETPTLTGVCINCGICYGMCPAVVDYNMLKKDVFGDSPADELLGTYVQALSVETTDAALKARCQDGGAVTALLSSLLEAGYIDGAVVVGVAEEPWRPVVRVATTTEEPIGCAGSKYSPAPVFIGLRDAVDLYYCESVAVVGTPCQILASRRINFSNPTNRHLGDVIKLRVGLFCGGVFGYSKFKTDIIDKQLHTPLTDVAKFDIKGNKFIIYHRQKPKQELALSAVKQHMDLSCKLCQDFTAELADISVGAAGSPMGRSTVLIRTPAGIGAFEAANRFGRFNVVELEKVKPGIKGVRQEAKAKKSMAMKELETIRRLKQPLPVWLQERPPEAPKETIESLKEIHAVATSPQVDKI